MQKKICCAVCGKFISYEEIYNGDAILEYTPDSHFTFERIEYTHKKCTKTNKNYLTNEN